MFGGIFSFVYETEKLSGMGENEAVLAISLNYTNDVIIARNVHNFTII